MVVVVLFVAARIIFVLENNQSVAMCFLSLGLTLPLAVLAFFAFAGGADRE